MFPLGKLPPKPVTLQFGDYMPVVGMRKPYYPPPPKKRPVSFGHEALVPATGWGMLGNQKYGNCIFAAAAHETMLWNREAKVVVPFTDKSVLSDYSAVTGFDPAKPETDQGAYMADVASYRRKTGVLDSKGKRHKIVAYLGLYRGDTEQLYQACWLFGAVGVGLQLPESAGEQFDAGKPWVLPYQTSPPAGGHAVSVVAKRGKLIRCVTWGKLQSMDEEFYFACNDESLAYVSYERLTNGRSLEGFDAARLLADLWKINQAA